MKKKIKMTLFRSHVWSEEMFLDEAAADFADTEAMLKTAEVNHIYQFLSMKLLDFTDRLYSKQLR